MVTSDCKFTRLLTLSWWHNQEQYRIDCLGPLRLEIKTQPVEPYISQLLVSGVASQFIQTPCNMKYSARFAVVVYASQKLWSSNPPCNTARMHPCSWPHIAYMIRQTSSYRMYPEKSSNDHSRMYDIESILDIGCVCAAINSGWLHWYGNLQCFIRWTPTYHSLELFSDTTWLSDHVTVLTS